MSKRDVAATLRAILDLTGEISLLLRTRSRADLESNREFLRALERCVELMGEAGTRLPPAFREEHAEVPWRQIIGMRNVMIHGYDVISADVLWDTASQDVPRLRLQIEAILKTIAGE
jgi:uncharacterized protein with HEPN domain